MATIELIKINLTPGMREAQRFVWSGTLISGSGTVGEGAAVGIVVYSRTDPQGFPEAYDPTLPKVGGWCFDLLNARGEAVIRGAGLSVGIDLLWPYRAYPGVPPGSLLAWSPSGLDLTLDDFAEGSAEIYYWPPGASGPAIAGAPQGPRP